MTSEVPDPVEEAFSGYVNPRLWPSLRGIGAAYGSPRALQWDAVATATAPGLEGEEVRFAAGRDGTIRCDQASAVAVEPLRHAVAELITPPFAAVAERRDGDVWAVAANRADVVDLPVQGDEIAVTSIDGEVTVTVDGEESDLRLPGLEDMLEGDCTVMAHRFVDSAWVAETFPL